MTKKVGVQSRNGVGKVKAWVLLCLLLPFGALAYDPEARTLMANKPPPELEGIGIFEKLGDHVDLDLPFQDETGATLPLREFYKSSKPVILSLVYYSCPHLCNFHLNGLVDTLKEMKWDVGNQFEIVAISIDPNENAELAQAKKANYLKAYGRPETAKGWHFLTGSQESITKIAEQVGYKYRWDAAGEQWAHASAAVLTTPEGKISRYMHGIQFDPQSLRLGLLEASEGKVGNVFDSIVMFCFQFDPAQRKYVLYGWNVMRAMAGLTVMGLGAFLTAFWIRQRKQNVEGVPS